MFKIEVTKLDNTVEHIYNMNKNEDDFLQFVPKQFGVTSSDMKAYIMPDTWKDELEAYLKLDENNSLDLSEEGKIKVINITSSFNEVTEVEEESLTVVKEYVGTLIEYPYDSEGKFLGNGYEL